MPYLSEADKAALEARESFEKAGELNYVITTFCIDYIQSKGLSYATINDIVGALESAKLEFYRRVAVPYEEQKKFENGDVYGFEQT